MLCFLLMGLEWEMAIEIVDLPMKHGDCEQVTP